MNKIKCLFLTLLYFPLALAAQDSDKYMAGAVPLVNGKVIFEQTFSAPLFSQDEIFNRIVKWAEQRFSKTENRNGRLLYTNKEKGEIACWGEEYLVFSSTALSLDRTLIYYQLILNCEPGSCRARITSIRYDYNIATQNKPDRYVAEEIITDAYTLNKKQDKLIRKTGKFRIHTIDMKNELFTGIASALSAGVTAPAAMVQTTVVSPTVPASVPAARQTAAIPAEPVNSGNALPGYRRIAPDRIPGNIIKMLSEDWMLITAGNDNGFNMMTASWGGLGHLYNKPVSLCFINPARYTYQLMENGDTYTLTFYTEIYREALNYCGHHSGKDGDKVKVSGLTPITLPSGAKAFSEAWLIIECRKLVSQSLIPEALSDPDLKTQWSGKPMHKMYIGEILNVWVK